MPESAEPTTLLNLTGRDLADLTSSDDTTLTDVMRRLFDPRERDLVTVSAFASSL